MAEIAEKLFDLNPLTKIMGVVGILLIIVELKFPGFQ